MNDEIRALRQKRDAAARRLILLDGWQCSPQEVARAVQAILIRSRLSTLALSWLVKEIAQLSVPEEAEECLADLVLSVAVLERFETEDEEIVDFENPVTESTPVARR